MSTGQLYAYRRRFAEEASSSIEDEQSTLPKLVPVEVVEAQRAIATSGVTGEAVEVAVGSNVLLRFRVGADANYMAEVIAGLGRRLGC